MRDDRLMLHSLKELTRKIRPICDIDGMPVGAIWYQLKKQTRVMTEEIDGLYRGNLTICIPCYFNCAFPPHLSADDFEKCDILSLTAGGAQSDRWSNEEYVQLMDAVKESGGKDWEAVFKKLPHKKEEDIILKFLKLPFVNLSHVFLLEEKHILDKMGSNPEGGFAEARNITNPLEPHFSIFKDFLAQFRARAGRMREEPPAKRAARGEMQAFKQLVNTQLDIITDRIGYLEEFEDIVIHEKRQLEQYNRRLYQNRFKHNLAKTGPHASSSAGPKSAVNFELLFN